MATLSSNSTDAEVWAAYDDTASYEEEASRAKALAFVTACRILRRRLPLSAGRGPQSVTRESLDAEIVAAQQWLDANPATTGSGSGRVRYLSMENFREVVGATLPIFWDNAVSTSRIRRPTASGRVAPRNHLFRASRGSRRECGTYAGHKLMRPFRVPIIPRRRAGVTSWLAFFLGPRKDPPRLPVVAGTPFPCCG